MTVHPDLRSLHDAFAELERRADVAPVAGQPGSRPAAHRTPSRPVLIAASIVTVLAVATGVGLLAGLGSGSSSPSGASRPAGPASSAASAPVSSPAPSHPSTQPSSSASTNPSAGLPTTPTQLARRFRAVLGKTATITFDHRVSEGAFIVGRLTRTSNGHSGGFDLQIDPGSPGDKAFCEDADTSHCIISRLPDGSSLSVGHETLGGGGLLYLVDLVRPDGVSLLMHLSNTADPKSGGPTTGPKPPLSRKDIVKDLRSPRWG